MRDSGAGSADAETRRTSNLAGWIGHGPVNLQCHFDQSSGTRVFRELLINFVSCNRSMVSHEVVTIVVTGATVRFQQSQSAIWRRSNSRWQPSSCSQPALDRQSSGSQPAGTDPRSQREQASQVTLFNVNFNLYCSLSDSDRVYFSE